MRAHPAADVFPMMTEGELAALAKDIGNNGQHTPIVTVDGHGEWLILDGRNRAEACKRAGVHPKTVVFSGTDPFAFVVSCNLHRRHLDSSQRAMIAERLATLKRGGNGGVHANAPKEALTETASQVEAAELLGVSRGSVQRARRVRERGVPELVAAVESGAVSVTAAAVVATLPVEEQHRLVANGAHAVAERAHHRDPEPSAPRLVVHKGGIAQETQPGVLRVLGSRPHTGGKVLENPEGHAAVRELTARGMTITDIINETGFEKKFIVYARGLISKEGGTVKPRKGPLDNEIMDVELFGEGLEGSMSRNDPRWLAATNAERKQLADALAKCRTSISRSIKWLNKEATEGAAE